MCTFLKLGLKNLWINESVYVTFHENDTNKNAGCES